MVGYVSLCSSWNRIRSSKMEHVSSNKPTADLLHDIATTTPESPSWCTPVSRRRVAPQNSALPIKSLGGVSSEDEHCRELPPGCLASQLRRGQLKLMIYANHGHLTLHVLEGRQLECKRNDKCNSYVKVELLPNNDANRVCQTETHYNSVNPCYDEKFSFELMDEDRHKRLLVSVWDKSNANCNEFVGCMSFGVRHLMCRKKQVDGWYYLLSDDVGKRKHLQASGKRPFIKPCITGVKETPEVPELNKAVEGRECITLVLKRSKTGYGFTVMGSCPVTIGRCEPGTPAEAAGLQKGDAVVKINGQNVSRSTADSVAKIVKNCSRQMVLDVYRIHNKENIEPTSSNIDCNHAKTILRNSNREQSCQSTPRKRPSDNEPVYAKITKYDTSNDNLYSQIDFRDSHMFTMDTPASALLNVKTPSQCTTPRRRNVRPNQRITRSVSKDSVVAIPAPQTSPASTNNKASSVGKFHVNGPMTTPVTRHLDNDLYITMVSGLNPNFSTVTTEVMTEDEDEEDSDYELNYGRLGSLPELSSSYSSTSTADTSDNEIHMQAADNLMDCEESFVRQMQAGIACYSRPLRHCILTPQQHTTLFQNIEKLTVISEFLVSQMTSHKVDFGAIYHPKMTMLCDAYERYCGGITEALQLLAELRRFTEFQQFLQRVPRDESTIPLETFLSAPILHFANLARRLEDVLITSSDTSNNHNLHEVVTVIFRSCNKLTEDAPSNYTRTFSMVSSQSSAYHSKMSLQSKSSTKSSASSVASTMSVDSEVLEIQSRLLFPKHLQAFQVATANRHLIYISELMWNGGDDSKHWVRINVMLFNDLLLLVQADSKKFWTVVANPIFLNDVVATEFDSKHPSEFMLTVNQFGNAQDRRYVKFRSFTIEQKYTWKTLLEQRITSCRSQQELMSCRASDII